MTLGQAQGAALIGRPLNLSIPVSLGENESGDGFCAEAEILQGSSRIDPGRVTVTVESDPRSGGSRLRVRSSTVIDEPVITVNLRAGCAMKSTRQYVLLSDMPSDPSLPAVAGEGGSRRGGSATSDNGATTFSARTPTFPPVPSSDADRARRRANAEAVLANAQRAASTPTESSTAPREAAREAAPRAVAPSRASVAAGATSAVPTAAPRAAPRTTPAAVAAVPAPPTAALATPSRSRLQLDSAVPATARAPALAASAASSPARAASAVAPVVPAAALPATATATANAPAAATAASAPVAAAPAASSPLAEGGAAVAAPAVAAPSPTSEETERALRLQVMEATLTALRAQTAENQRTLSDVRAELVASRESRYLNPMVYALFGLLLLALLAIAFLLRSSRRRAASAWWNDSVVREEDPRGPEAGGGPAVAARSRPAPLVPADALAAQGVRNDAEAEEKDAAEKRQVALALARTRAQEEDAEDADLAPARAVNTEELFDVQQQSDFFLSLGQHAQAIAVLSEHIAENPQTSALAYLDLLRIHHSLGNRDAYGRVGQEFEREFNATLPSFDSFNDGGNGLEHYRSTLARITEHWPALETLVLIEELVFRRPGTDGNEAFDLAAYQELLLLYAVAKEVIDPDSAPPAPVTPLSYLDTAAHGPTTAPSPLTSQASPTRPAAFMPYEMPLSPVVATVPAALAAASAEIATAPAPLTAGPSLFGSLDEHADDDAGEDTHPGDLEGPTARVPLFPDAPLLPAMEAPADTSGDTISDLTRDTTLDSNLIEFDLFDPEVEAKIAPKPTRY